ncbi:MAG: sulfite exporter TauE/SafE family protein [Desulfobacterales bacterium]
MRIDLAAVFVLGLLATPHCLGMCGPLVIAFPGASGRFLAHLAYHAGRVLCYALVGGALGGIGELVSGGLDPQGAALRSAGRVLSGVAAAALFLLGLNRLGWVREPRFLAEIPLHRLPGVGRRLEGGFPPRGSPAAFFLLGILFGILPCGLSWAVFALALGTADFATGLSAAVWFGLGTVPGLLLLGTVASAFFRRHRRACETLAGLLMVWMGCRLAYRAIQTALTL